MKKIIIKIVFAFLFILTNMRDLNNVKIINAAAEEATSYFVTKRQNIIIYNSNGSTTEGVLEDIIYTIYNGIEYSGGEDYLSGYIISYGDRIVSQESGTSSPFYKINTESENIVIIFKNKQNWFYYSLDYDYIAKYDGDSIEQTELNINYNFNTFRRNYIEYGTLKSNLTTKFSKEIRRGYYFKNLNKNIGNNTNGSCTYIALGMLLSYFDIFYDNRVLSDSYMKEEYISDENLKMCHKSPGYTEDFHQFLIRKIGVEHFKYVTYDKDGKASYGATIIQTAEILTYYINHYTTLTKNNYEVEIIEGEDEIKSYLNQDIPIILFANSWATDDNIELRIENESKYEMAIRRNYNRPHAVLAYGYEEMSNRKTYYKTHLGYIDQANKAFLPYDEEIYGLVLNVKYNRNNCSTGAYIYKDSITQEETPYCPKCADSTYKDIHIYCGSGNYETDTYIEKGNEITYEFNIGCHTRYQLNISTNEHIDMYLYDENSNLLDYGDFIQLSSGIYKYFIEKDLSKGKYYLKVKYYDEEAFGTIHTTIRPRGLVIENIEGKNEVDVLEHLHNNQNSFTLYANRNKVYRFELIGIKNDSFIYPNNAITITDNNEEIVSRLPNEVENNIEAITSNHANSILLHAKRGITYKIKINFDVSNVSSLKLYITTQEDFETNKITNGDYYFECYKMSRGDAGKIISITRKGTYDFWINYTGRNYSPLVSILKENESGEFIPLITKQLNSKNKNLNYEFNVTQPTNFMICYYNGANNEVLNIDIGKQLTQIFTIQTDISNEECGSEVSLNQGNLGGTTITQGYTRNLYLGEDAPDKSSNLKYDWYSLNENIAKVSEYGTITAVGVGKATIQAVYKDDPSIVAEISIEVLPYPDADEPTFLQYGMDVRIGGTISGTEVTSGKGNAIPVGINPEVTIHRGYTRLICLGDDSPTTSVQDFNWEVMNQLPSDTGIVSVSNFGTITGTQEGFVTIKGTYKYNPNYMIYIRVQVI